MADRDIAPDPIDKAYLEAEAVLGDDAARAVRRARMLAAVVQQTADTEAATPVRQRPIRRPGRWLVAACLTGLAAVVGLQIYPLLPHKPEPRPVTLISPPPPSWTATARPAQSPAEAAPHEAATSPRRAATVIPQFSGGLPAPPVLAPRPPAAPPPLGVAAPPPFAQSSSAPAPAAPLALAPPPAPPAAAPIGSQFDHVVVTAEKRRPEAVAELGARLRAAATQGHTAEVKALLDQGVPIDAEDADGDTALMKAIQADRVDAAALLHDRGASLDHTNHAGRSARYMATMQGDAGLNEALNLEP